MLIGRIADATHNLGAPKNWDEERSGKCGHLPVRLESARAGPAFTSAWFPEPDEIERIKAGAPIYLTIFGQSHPPVAMATGQAPSMDEGGAPLKVSR